MDWEVSAGPSETVKSRCQVACHSVVDQAKSTTSVLFYRHQGAIQDITDVLSVRLCSQKVHLLDVTVTPDFSTDKKTRLIVLDAGTGWSSHVGCGGRHGMKDEVSLHNRGSCRCWPKILNVDSRHMTDADKIEAVGWSVLMSIHER